MYKKSTLFICFFLILCGTAQAQFEVLRFPKDSSTTDTLQVNTAQTQAQVVYNIFRQITYVSKPVDVNYQSLDVYVPTHARLAQKRRARIL